MQKGPLLDRPPIAPVERVVADEVDGAGDIPPSPPRHHQQNAIRQRRADQVEETASQIGPPHLREPVSM